MVTAPTCGACGIVPGVLYFLRHHTDDVTDEDVIDALAVAGVIGNITKVNASISGAEAGCQAEVGTACAMAAGAATFLMGGSTEQIEYAASMAIEHMLGLTCDPVKGLVQVPCIERNAMAAGRALECAQYALMTNTFHIISFDEVIMTMILTGEDIEDALRETSKAGLAQTYNLDELARKQRMNAPGRECSAWEYSLKLMRLARLATGVPSPPMFTPSSSPLPLSVKPESRSAAGTLLMT